MNRSWKADNSRLRRVVAIYALLLSPLIFIFAGHVVEFLSSSKAINPPIFSFLALGLLIGILIGIIRLYLVPATISIANDEIRFTYPKRRAIRLRVDPLEATIRENTIEINGLLIGKNQKKEVILSAAQVHPTQWQDMTACFQKLSDESGNIPEMAEYTNDDGISEAEALYNSIRSLFSRKG